MTSFREARLQMWTNIFAAGVGLGLLLLGLLEPAVGLRTGDGVTFRVLGFAVCWLGIRHGNDARRRANRLLIEEIHREEARRQIDELVAARPRPARKVW